MRNCYKVVQEYDVRLTDKNEIKLTELPVVAGSTENFKINMLLSDRLKNKDLCRKSFLKKQPFSIYKATFYNKEVTVNMPQPQVGHTTLHRPGNVEWFLWKTEGKNFCFSTNSTSQVNDLKNCIMNSLRYEDKEVEVKMTIKCSTKTRVDLLNEHNVSDQVVEDLWSKISVVSEVSDMSLLDSDIRSR